ncbi:MAG TPA: hypothetical protein VM056_01830, partial [Terriglobales bacterium]|nr:hypothetical protein [Terriglobales bacterium]
MPKALSDTEVLEPRSDVGGRGPDGRPPAGDDGDDEWGGHSPGRRGPRDRLHRYRTGVGLGVVGIYMFFIALCSAYLVRQGTESRNAAGEFVRDWQPIIIPGILWINTALLALSSVSVEFARRQLFSETLIVPEWLGIGTPTRRRSLPWLGITLLLGAAFLIGQYLAWKSLNTQGVFISTNPSSSFFFILTGAHAVHLVGGLTALV